MFTQLFHLNAPTNSHHLPTFSLLIKCPRPTCDQNPKKEAKKQKNFCQPTQSLVVLNCQSFDLSCSGNFGSYSTITSKINITPKLFTCPFRSYTFGGNIYFAGDGTSKEMILVVPSNRERGCQEIERERERREKRERGNTYRNGCRALRNGVLYMPQINLD